MINVHIDIDLELSNDLDDSNPARGHISDAIGYMAWGELRLRSKTGERSERLI